MWHFSIFIGNRRKHKTTDIWRCANEDQCVPDKTGCSCRTITRGVRLARQGCWCCACRSSSPVLHESYCRITSWSWYQSTARELSCIMSNDYKILDWHNSKGRWGGKNEKQHLSTAWLREIIYWMVEFAENYQTHLLWASLKLFSVYIQYIKEWKLRITGTLSLKPPVTDGFPSHRASNPRKCFHDHNIIIFWCVISDLNTLT